MKKFRKVIKKLPMKIIAIVLVLAILINYIEPLSKVFADDEYSYTLTFTVAENQETEHTMQANGNNGDIIIDGQYVSLKNGEDIIGTSECHEVESKTVCTISVEDGPAGRLNFNSANKFDLYMQGHSVSLEHDFTGDEDIAVQDYVAPPVEDPVEPGPDGPRFDGRAVVLWSCGSGDTGVCFHEFGMKDPEHCDPENYSDACDPEIGDFNDGNSTFFRDTYVTADNKPGTTFDVDAEYKEWYLTDEFQYWQELYKLANNMAPDAEINWEEMDRELIMGAPNQHIGELIEQAEETCGSEPDEHATDEERDVHERCINRYAAEVNHEIWTHELQPVNEPEGTNAYVSYGDRNFKVVIYNNEYKGVSTTADFNGLNYYPISWADRFTRTDQYNVGGTDIDHPTELLSILLEDTVNLDVLDINDYEISTIEALDVPADAVTITKINSRKFKIVFSSHFYDNVEFKITDTDGEKQYVKIKRFTIDGYIRNNNTLRADFYYDVNDSYEEFIITAKVIYYNGNIEYLTLTPIDHFEDSLGNPINSYVANQEVSIGPNQGKGLNLSAFEAPLGEDAERRVKDIYLNAEYTGSSTSEYAGAYSGSGEGTQANLYHPEGGE